MKDNDIFNKIGCINSETFESAKNDKLTDLQWSSFDKHINSCEMCSDAYDGILISNNSKQIVDDLRIETGYSKVSEEFGNHRRLYAVISAAASIIIIFGIYFFMSNQDVTQSNGFAEFIPQSDNYDLNRPEPSEFAFVDIGEDHATFTEQRNSKVFNPGTAKEKDNYSDQIFTYSEEMPEYPGGILELNEFIKGEVFKAEKEQKIRSCGKVFVDFIINEKGEVTNPVVVGGGSKKLNKAAISIIKKLPKWKPGYQSGEAVNVAFTLPVKFDNC